MTKKPDHKRIRTAKIVGKSKPYISDCKCPLIVQNKLQDLLDEDIDLEDTLHHIHMNVLHEDE